MNTQQIFIAAHANNEELLTSLLEENRELIDMQDENGFSALRIAVEKGFGEMAEALLEMGADANSKDKHGYTPLHVAPDVDFAEMLVEFGADVNAADNYGLTPLHNAIIEGHIDIVKMLIKSKAELSIMEYKGYTPLYMAKKYGMEEIAELLEEAGAIE